MSDHVVRDAPELSPFGSATRECLADPTVKRLVSAVLIATRIRPVMSNVSENTEIGLLTAMLFTDRAGRASRQSGAYSADARQNKFLQFRS